MGNFATIISAGNSEEKNDNVGRKLSFPYQLIKKTTKCYKIKIRKIQRHIQ